MVVEGELDSVQCKGGGVKYEGFSPGGSNDHT